MEDYLYDPEEDTGNDNLIATSVINNFANFLRDEFNNFDNGINDLKTFYCFLLLRHLDGDEILLKQIMFQKEDDEVKNGFQIMNIFMPQGPHDLVLKTLILFRAMTDIALTELDGVQRAVSSRIIALGLPVQRDLGVMDLFNWDEDTNFFDSEVADHSAKINCVNMVMKPITNVLYFMESPIIDTISKLYRLINNLKNKEVSTTLYQSIHSFLTGSAEFPVHSFDSGNIALRYYRMQKQDLNFDKNFILKYQGKAVNVVRKPKTASDKFKKWKNSTTKPNKKLPHRPITLAKMVKFWYVDQLGIFAHWFRKRHLSFKNWPGQRSLFNYTSESTELVSPEKFKDLVLTNFCTTMKNDHYTKPRLSFEPEGQPSYFYAWARIYIQFHACIGEEETLMKRNYLLHYFVNKIKMFKRVVNEEEEKYDILPMVENHAETGFKVKTSFHFSLVFLVLCLFSSMPKNLASFQQGLQQTKIFGGLGS